MNRSATATGTTTNSGRRPSCTTPMRGCSSRSSRWGNAVGGQIGQWLTPMLKSWSDWLDEARKTPETMEKVEFGVDAVAVLAGRTAAAGAEADARDRRDECGGCRDTVSNPGHASRAGAGAGATSVAAGIAALLGGLTFVGKKGLDKQARAHGVIVTPEGQAIAALSINTCAALGIRSMSACRHGPRRSSMPRWRGKGSKVPAATSRPALPIGGLRSLARSQKATCW